ncbi:hypothetical protein FB645_001305 [Coemansia sp. IMI 203386]|nr:hypothetical protein FB645_001305 [Coemansia sp. IMI 203386]
MEAPDHKPAKIRSNEDVSGPYIADEAAVADDGDSSGLVHFLSDTAGSKKGKTRRQQQQQQPLPGKTDLPRDEHEEKHAVDLLQSAYKQMIDVPAKKSRKSCFGHLEPDGRLVAITEKPVETITRTSGTARAGVVYLQPEEWVLFAERGSLVVRSQASGSELAVEDLAGVWAMALGRAALSLDKYRAYSYLRRLGYVVVCPASEASSSADCRLADSTASALSQPFWKRWTSWTVWENWSGWTNALTARSSGHTHDDVYNDLLRRAPRNAASEAAIAHSAHSGGYSVYKPEHPYKKRDPGQPQYRLIVRNSQSRVPAADELLAMAHSDSTVATILGISEPAVAGFLKIDPSVVPEAPHRRRQSQLQRQVRK